MDEFKAITPDPRPTPQPEEQIVSSSSSPPTGETSRHLEAMIRRAQKISVNYRKNFKEACQGTASPRQAIKAKCQECVGYQETVESIRTCTGYGCPLWAYRPYQDKGTPDGA